MQKTKIKQEEVDAWGREGSMMNKRMEMKQQDGENEEKGRKTNVKSLINTVG